MKTESKTNISTFSYNGQDIDILMHKGTISYVFERNGNRYGNAVKLEGKTKLDMMNACFALILNYLDTYAKVT